MAACAQKVRRVGSIAGPRCFAEEYHGTESECTDAQILATDRMLVASGGTDWNGSTLSLLSGTVGLCADGDNMVKSASLLLYSDRGFGSSAPERRFAGGMCG